MNRSAIISPDGLYRYRLDRDWRTPLDRELNATSKGGVLFVMLNPSTADGEADDPTIRRCIDFAKRWGHDRLIACNVFAFRATDPKELARHIEAGGSFGPANYQHLRTASDEASRVVVAWGASGAQCLYWRYAQKEAVASIQGEAAVPRELFSIGAPTKDGHPRHPLHLKANEQLQPWSPRA